MVPKPDQEKIKALLTEAITVLCKNGLSYDYNCGIQGLLGITLDDEDVFLVDIKESIVKATRPEPEEETAKQSSETSAPQSPAHTQSPSGTGRRRRRRSGSQLSEASPAKRPAYSDDQASPDDVIVIKEELAESDMAQIYGDPGNEQIPQDDSYAMALPQDSGGDYGGAGCSQWDTSSNSSQSTWPQQLPQYDATQQPSATSSAMPPTQMLDSGAYEWERTTPKCNLTNEAVRNALSEALVTPTLARQLSVSAVRLGWFANTAAELQPIYENLPNLRAELAKRIATLPGITYFVSCLTATMSGKRKRLSFPGVSFWIVSEQGVTALRIVEALGDKLGATLKFLMQPYQDIAKHAEPVLFTVTKDCLDGVVRKVLDRMALTTGRNLPYAVTKIHTLRKERKWLENVATRLGVLGVTVDIEEL